MRKNKTESPSLSGGASDVDPTEAAELLSSGGAEALCALASDRRAAPEVLFVLSQSNSESIRARVAANPATPAVVDRLLVSDGAQKVRAELGRKIARLLPHFSERSLSGLQDAAAAKLLILAKDSEVVVRRTLAAEIARLDCAPREVVMMLVRDLDELVAAPIAEFSPMLDDDDLVALIGEGPSAATLSAFARRDGLASEVSDCLIATDDATVITTLLRNTTAFIRESTLDDLIDRASSVEFWHEPLVGRPELTERLVSKLSKFVADGLLGRLAARGNLSPQLRVTLEKRLSRQAPSSPEPTSSESDIVGAIKRHASGTVIAGLSVRADVNTSAIKRVFAARTPQAIVALAWKAGLSMQTAAMLQAFPGKIPETRRIAASDDGSYPLSRDDLEWQLNSLGLGNAVPKTGTD